MHIPKHKAYNISIYIYTWAHANLELTDDKPYAYVSLYVRACIVNSSACIVRIDNRSFTSLDLTEMMQRGYIYIPKIRILAEMCIAIDICARFQSLFCFAITHL